MLKILIFFLSLLLVSVFFCAKAQTSAVPPPGNLAANAVSSTEIHLSWSDYSSNETGFQIERSLTSGSGFTVIATLGANITSHPDRSLTANTLYYYRVRAFNPAIGNSYYSSVVGARTNNSPPSVPTNLIATAASFSQINLTWTDNSSNETGFQIWRSLSSGSGFTLIATTTANATSYSSTGLNANKKYFYRVRAINADGNSAYTPEVNATTMPLPNPPSAPSNLAATAISSTQVNLTWADNSSNETAFQIERSLSSGTGFTLIATTAANATSYPNTGLTGGTKYYYRVRAINAGGISALTSEANATTLIPPIAPSQVQVQASSSSSIVVTWQDNSNDENYFRIEWLETYGGGGEWIYMGPGISTSTGTSHAIGGLKSGTVYNFRVSAFNSVGNSTYSYSNSVVTFPSLPSGLAAQGSASSITLNWTVTGNAQSPTWFQVERSTAESAGFSAIHTTAEGARSFADQGLTAGTTYFYRIRATNSSGSSGYTPVTSARILLPAAPGGVTAQVSSGSSITLTWIDNSDNETAFEVHRVPGITSSQDLIGTTLANVTSFADGGVSGGKSYIYRIRSVNAFGSSAFVDVNIFLPLVNNHNWIKETVVFQKDTHDESEVENLVITEGQKSVTWNYFDGLGRPMQSVNVQASPIGKDVVQPIVYDEFGRESKRYLPYTDGTNGWFKTDFNPESGPLFDFYQNTAGVADDGVPFSTVHFEASPLSRPLKEYGPGEAWSDAGEDRYVAHGYKVNVHEDGEEIEEIVAWNINSNGQLGRAPVVDKYVEDGGFYSTGQISIKETTDEAGHRVREYTDKQGRVILKKVQAVANASVNNDAHWAQTYYIYDDFGNLVMVLPPEAVKALLEQ